METSALAAARAAGLLGAYCEHREHCEPARLHDVETAAQLIRSEAAALALDRGVSLASLYTERIRGVEQHSLLRPALPEHQPGGSGTAGDSLDVEPGADRADRARPVVPP